MAAARRPPRRAPSAGADWDCRDWQNACRPSAGTSPPARTATAGGSWPSCRPRPEDNNDDRHRDRRRPRRDPRRVPPHPRVPKRSTPTLLVEAVRAAVAGDALISPQITVRLLRHLARPAPHRPAAGSSARPAPYSALTGRQIDVVGMIAAGRTNAEIAGALHLSHSTVKNYIAAIQDKLGTRNRVEIAAWAWDNGHATSQET
ncbi:MAG: hypothetical protein GEV11_24280 [Streptosporangiales bacterium]|nr:hypothetical protein [Streptosporangiales bacterium]